MVLNIWWCQSLSYLMLLHFKSSHSFAPARATVKWIAQSTFWVIATAWSLAATVFAMTDETPSSAKTTTVVEARANIVNRVEIRGDDAFESEAVLPQVNRLACDPEAKAIIRPCIFIVYEMP